MKWYEDDLNMFISSALYTSWFTQRVEMSKMKQEILLGNRKGKINNYVVTAAQWDKLITENNVLKSENIMLKDKLQKIQQKIISAVNNSFN